MQVVNPQYLRCSFGVNRLVSGKYTRPSSGSTHRLRRFAFSSSSGVSAVIMAISKSSLKNLPLSSKSSMSMPTTFRPKQSVISLATIPTSSFPR